MMAKKVTLKSLLEAGVHFGHQAKRWHPKMEPYLYAVRDGVHIIDLLKTKKALEEACDYVQGLAAKGGQIVFIGTKRQAQAIIQEESKKAGFPYVTQRWLGGLISNWEQLKKNIESLTKMKAAREKGEYQKYTKKEQILLDRKIARLEKFYSGLTDLTEPPEAIFLVDVKKEKAAVKEAHRKGVVVVALVDSNSDPLMVDYVIPANDDAVGSIKIIVAAVAAAAKAGRDAWLKKKPKEKND